MKKILLLIGLLLPVCAFAAPESQSRLFIAPGRETFFNFPSEIMGNIYSLTMYLPEDAVPLKGRYPVVYYVGLDREHKDIYSQFAKKNKVLLVGIGLTEKELARQTKQTGDFITQELIPYIDTNYATFDSPDKRVIIAQGKYASRVAVEAFNQGHSIYNLALQDAQGAVENINLPQASTRIFVRDTPTEQANNTQLLQAQNSAYGTGFFLQNTTFDANVLDEEVFDYLFAPEADVSLKNVQAVAGVKTLSLKEGKSASLQIITELKNGLKGVYVPQTLRMSPPYLNWNSTMGMVAVISGAESGPVKISGFVDNLPYSTEIMLKKQ